MCRHIGWSLTRGTTDVRAQGNMKALAESRGRRGACPGMKVG